MQLQSSHFEDKGWPSLPVAGVPHCTCAVATDGVTD